ncbi:winged helix-turn-helix domain-containing protein [Paenibacillus lycopersici]|uniref:Winged helix-turn-helix domain-containing protein n=1 Tax=Paenibacillus lycopersici TaxID=2704462 RepID=A0A6C0FZE9_9BACL|nr:crosslink repair DNA glycosylase YcaQ family protein [Paenibacillus lycopersici]QHT61452.1 winged helix-turn-helix domain-containing protein [Paenibacillus lycopersici]
MEPIRTTKRALRRLLLDRQGLLAAPQPRADSDEARSKQAMAVIRQLEGVQIDPVSAVRPNQHLTLAARIAGYAPDALNGLLPRGEVFEYIANAACILPMEDYPIFEPTRRLMRQHTEARVEALRPVIEQVLLQLEREGPLPAKAFESDVRVHGYWDDANAAAKTKATSLALQLLVETAQVQIAGRAGNQRLFELSSRYVPADLLRQSDAIGQEEAENAMLLKYYRAYGVFEPSDSRFGWLRLPAQGRRDAIARHVAGGTAAQVAIDGLKQPYYILTADRERLAVHQEADAELDRRGQVDDLANSMNAAMEDDSLPFRFIPPLDNVLWSRKRLEDLFGFEYRWEIYTPAVKRKYGYYAMPILAGDRFIGRMDPRLDTKRRHLTVELLQLEPGLAFDGRFKRKLEDALETFARTHGAETLTIERYALGE